MNKKSDNEDSHPPSGILTRIKKYFRNPFFIKTQSKTIHTVPYFWIDKREIGIFGDF